MLVQMKNMTGGQAGEIELDDSVFAAPISKPLMHQALVRQLANARLGTHKTKTRKEVRGGGRKPWRQKGTGRARQGSTRSPNWVGGGTVFGPQPRKYTKAMPKKMRRAALRSALSIKAAADEIVVLDDLSMSTPKTRAFVEALDALSMIGQTILILWSERDEVMQRSANNLPEVKTLHAGYLNIRDLLGYDVVVADKGAVAYIEEWLSLGGDNATLMVADAADEDVDEAVGDAIDDLADDTLTGESTGKDEE